jgi:hypothetical protein
MMPKFLSDHTFRHIHNKAIQGGSYLIYLESMTAALTTQHTNHTKIK